MVILFDKTTIMLDGMNQAVDECGLVFDERSPKKPRNLQRIGRAHRPTPRVRWRRNIFQKIDFSSVRGCSEADYTTIFTMRPGTTITFFGDRPSS